MPKNQRHLFGVYWRGESFESAASLYSFTATILMDGKNRFTGRWDDTIGTADIIQGRFMNKGDLLVFRVKYDAKVQRKGAHKAAIEYQFTPTDHGGWWGHWNVRSKGHTSTGQAMMGIK